MKWYIYRLSYDGTPFYIGLTRNMINRYKLHYAGYVAQTSALINNIRHATGDHVDMDVLHILECRHTAFQLEYANIRMYANQQIPICNNKWNDPHNVLYLHNAVEWKQLKRANYSNINTIIQNKIDNHESNRRK